MPRRPTRTDFGGLCWRKRDKRIHNTLPAPFSKNIFRSVLPLQNIFQQPAEHFTEHIAEQSAEYTLYRSTKTAVIVLITAVFISVYSVIILQLLLQLFPVLPPALPQAVLPLSFPFCLFCSWRWSHKCGR